eukprot:289512-Amphidinium_carterae.1
MSNVHVVFGVPFLLQKRVEQEWVFPNQGSHPLSECRGLLVLATQSYHGKRSWLAINTKVRLNAD